MIFSHPCNLKLECLLSGIPDFHIFMTLYLVRMSLFSFELLPSSEGVQNINELVYFGYLVIRFLGKNLEWSATKGLKQRPPRMLLKNCLTHIFTYKLG